MRFDLKFGVAFSLLMMLPSAAMALSNDVISDAAHYTVKISSSVEYPFGVEYKGTALGAGFVIDREKGWILTNAHVARWSPSILHVSFKDHPYVKAEKVYVDNHLDLAVIKVGTADIPEEATEARMGCGREVAAGEQVIAFGHPWSLDYTATRGIISGTKVLDGVETLQTDAALNPGNSGGPLINWSNGDIVGINAATFSKSETEGMNFAVPIQLACTVVQLLSVGKDPAPPILPLTFATTLNSRELVVGEAKPEWAGRLQVGDRILAVDGDTSARYASRVLDHMRGKEYVSILIGRDHQTQEIKVDVPQVKNTMHRLGVQVSGMTIGRTTITDNDPTEMYIHYVAEASVAEQAQFKEGDMILSVDGVATKSHADVLKVFQDKQGQKVEVVIKHARSAGSHRYEYYARKLDVADVFVVDEKGVQP
jgi:serine protease Do